MASRRMSDREAATSTRLSAAVRSQLEAAIDDLDAVGVLELFPPPPAAVDVDDLVDDNGTPLLVRAIFASDPKQSDASLALVKALLQAGASPTAADEDGNTSLHVCASKIKLEPEFAVAATEMLLEELSGRPPDADGRTPLEHAMALADCEGRTPLAVVIRQGRQLSPAGGEAAGAAAMVDAARLYVSRGAGLLLPSPAAAARAEADHMTAADADATPPQPASAAAPRATSTLLHEAAEWAPPTLVSVLLEAVDVEAAMAVANAQGDGPLQVALARGQRATAAALLDAFPAACEGPWPGAPRPAARSLAAALHRLVRTVVETPASAPVPPPMPPDYAGCVRLLVERKGAPVDPRDSRGRTPLAASLALGAPTAISHALLRHCRAVEAADTDGRCALMHAAAAGDAPLLSGVLQALRRAALSACSGATPALPPSGERRDERVALADRALLSAAPPLPAASPSALLRRVLAVDVRGESALSLASAARSSACVRALLEAHADVRGVNADGRGPMMMALCGGGKSGKDGESELVEVLRSLAVPPTDTCLALARRANPATANATANAATAAAATAAAATAAAVTAAAASDEELTAAGARAAALMALVIDAHGECALALAAARPASADAFEALVTALVASGVSVDKGGGSALIALAARGERLGVERLLAMDRDKALTAPTTMHIPLADLASPLVPLAGAGPPAQSSHSSVRALGTRADSAAVAAARGGHAETLLALLAHDGASASVPVGPLEQTALMAAAAAGSTECVQLLLRQVAGGGEASRIDATGWTALMHAARGGVLGCVEALLGARVDPHATDRHGRSCLAHAAAGGSVACIEVLYRCLGSGGAEALEAVDALGTTPLIEAAARAHDDAIAALVMMGASLDVALDAALRGPPSGLALCRARGDGGLGDGGDGSDVDPANGGAAREAAAAPACTAPAEAAAAPGFWLQAAHTLARVGGNGLLSWRAVQLRSPAAMVLPLLRSLRRAGLLEEEVAHRDHGRSLLHAAVLGVADGVLSEAHACAYASGLPHAQLLVRDGEGLTAIGLAAERGLEAVGLALETIVLRRLRALIEIAHAPAHEAHARRLAAQLHAYWPQLELRVHAYAPAAAHASAFDVLWLERWGASRTSHVLYTHAGRAQSKLPGERALWREVSLKIDGKAVLLNL